MVEEVKEVLVSCKCGYGWKTKSRLQRVSCPSCGGKVLVPKVG